MSDKTVIRKLIIEKTVEISQAKKEEDQERVKQMTAVRDQLVSCLGVVD